MVVSPIETPTSDRTAAAAAAPCATDADGAAAGDLRWAWIAFGAFVVLAAWCVRTLVGVGELSRFVEVGVRWMRDVEHYRRDVEGFQATVMRTRGGSLAEVGAADRAEDLLGARTARLISTCPLPRGGAGEPLVAWSESAGRLAAAVRALDAERRASDDGEASEEAVLGVAVARADMAVAVSRAVSELRARVTADVEDLGVGWWTMYALGAVLLLSTGALVLLLQRAQRQKIALRAHALSAREAEARYRSIFEHAVEGIFQSTRDGRLLAANPALARMLGYGSPEELLAIPGDTARAHHADPSRRDEWERLLAENGVVRNFEYRAKRKDGSTVRLSENVREVRGPDGALLFYEGTVEDVTERRRAEDEMQRLQRFYEKILTRIPASVAVLDTEGRFLYLNPASIRDADLRRRSLGRTDAEYAADAGIPASVAEARGEALRRCIETRDTVALEEAVPGPRGVRHFVRLHHPVAAADGTVRMIIRFGLDVTERRHLEENLRQSAKMEAVGRLAGGVAHDFNNILTVITGYCDLLAERLSERDPLRPLALEVRAAADRAAAVTGGLLAFSRRQVLAPRAVRLGASVRDMAPMLRRLMGEDVELVIEDAGGDGHVRVDEGSLTQVLVNLAANARDAMPRGGRFTVQVRPLDVPQPDHDAGEPRPAGEIPPGSWEVLQVRDTGEGIAPEHLPHLFEPFFTTKPDGRGAGLGLATVYGIVQQSGGHIAAESERGRGTLIRIALPRVPAPAAPPAEAHPAPAPQRGHGTVLVVEDEAPIRSLVCACLSRAGYRVLSATDGEAALRIAEEHGTGGIDLLVTDVVMPRMGGGPLAAALRERRPDLRVLFMSGYTDDTLVLHGISHEDQAFLQKPFRPAALLERVREVLERRRVAAG